MTFGKYELYPALFRLPSAAFHVKIAKSESHEFPQSYWGPSPPAAAGGSPLSAVNKQAAVVAI